MVEPLPADTFAPASRDDWLAAVAAMPTGAPFEALADAPSGRVRDRACERARARHGANRRPRRRPTLDDRPAGRSSGALRAPTRWRLPTSKAAQAVSRIVAQGSPTARGFGVAIGDRRDLAQTLEGIRLDLVSVRIEAGGHCADIARWLLEIARRRRGASTCRWVSTPLASSLRRGACRTWRGPSAISLPTRGLGSLLTADGRVFHEAGASPAQELGMALCAGVVRTALTRGRGPAARGGAAAP